MLGSSCCALGLGCLSCLAVGAQLCMPILGHCPHLWLWLWGEVKQTGVSSQWPCDLPHLGVCSQPSSWSCWPTSLVIHCLFSRCWHSDQSCVYSDPSTAGTLGLQSWWPVVPSPVTLAHAAVMTLQMCGSGDPWPLCSRYLLLLALVSGCWHTGLSPATCSGISQHPHLG